MRGRQAHGGRATVRECSEAPQGRCRLSAGRFGRGTSPKSSGHGQWPPGRWSRLEGALWREESARGPHERTQEPSEPAGRVPGRAERFGRLWRAAKHSGDARRRSWRAGSIALAASSARVGARSPCTVCATWSGTRWTRAKSTIARVDVSQGHPDADRASGARPSPLRPHPGDRGASGSAPARQGRAGTLQEPSKAPRRPLVRPSSSGPILARPHGRGAHC